MWDRIYRMKTGLTRCLVNHEKSCKSCLLLAIVIFAVSTAIGQVNDGVAALERGDKSRAKAIFEQTLKNDPRTVDAHTYLGMIAAEANELNEAERQFAAAASLAPTRSEERRVGK